MIFGGVEAYKFQLIKGSMSDKEVWEILLNLYEGDDCVKRKHMDDLMSQFKNLRWTGDDIVERFNVKQSAITHKAFVLGKK